MEYIFPYIQLLVSLVIVGLLVGKRKPNRRGLKRTEVVNMAVDYSLRMGGSKAEILSHALDAARMLDSSDGKKDFSDSELRIAIEAAFHARKSG